jgi:hypothetical protein
MYIAYDAQLLTTLRNMEYHQGDWQFPAKLWKSGRWLFDFELPDSEELNHWGGDIYARVVWTPNPNDIYTILYRVRLRRDGQWVITHERKDGEGFVRVFE